MFDKFRNSGLLYDSVRKSSSRQYEHQIFLK